MIETPLEFPSCGTTCRGVLDTPDADSRNLPCIVMAHGFGLTHASGLAPFKEAFCQAGYAVGHFDVYRGEPLAQSIKDQLEFLGRKMPV
jgi:hypothetical protein